MISEDLATPLGRDAKRARRRFPVAPSTIVGVFAGLVLLGFLFFALFVNDPFGGEPMVRLSLKTPPAEGQKADPARPAKTPDAAMAAKAPVAGPNQRVITVIDGASGARQDVVVGNEDPDKAAPAGAMTASSGGNPKLLEQARYGMVPIQADGQKPFTAYAERDEALAAKSAVMPSIAIVVGGLGVGAAKTADAIAKLPWPVTLAFTPYGSDPAKLVARARAQRHEVVLQVPMEPFDYPDNDPGPQTLLTSLDAEQNADRLIWHLSRFPGYVGIANFMGAKFVATEAALAPVIRDAAKRGLAFLDDGRAGRSLSGQLAEGQAMPFGRGDVTLDLVSSAADIDRALAKLETIARERGVAIGTASALPLSIERLAAWTKQLESRGIVLVPLTMAMLKSKSN